MTITLAVMARAPIAGRCKTRLAPAFGDEGAATLYRAMLLDTLDALGALDAAGASRKVVMAAPEDDGAARLRLLVPSDWDVIEQQGDGLGARLAHAMTTLAGDGGAMVLCDSDSPTAPIGPIAAALPTLRDATRALLGPAADGGYYLLGVGRADVRVLDDIAWSTPQVAAQTRARLASCGFEWTELPVARDVDEPADVAWLSDELAAHPERAPRCAELLKSGRLGRR